MPYILALLGLIGAAYIWYIRLRGAAEMTQELSGVAQDVLAAARRFGFRRKLNLHPVESIDEPGLAVAALASAYLELTGLPTAEQNSALLRSLQSHLGRSLADAEELLILGRWLVNESNGPVPAAPRIARQLAKLDRKGGFNLVMPVLRDIAAAQGATSERQQTALEDIANAFGIRLS